MRSVAILRKALGSSLECSLLFGLLLDFGLKMHVGHGLGLEHDVGLKGLHHHG